MRGLRPEPAAIKALVGKGVNGCRDLKHLAGQLNKPRAVWVMLPAGAITQNTIERLGALLEPGDTVIDGGNAFYKDDIRRAKLLKVKGIHYIDCGTSGGIWGLDRGFCLMIGGEKEAVVRLDPIFAALAPGTGDFAVTPHRDGRDPRVKRGYMHCGPTGAGRFVKMIHNGIEYGLMQAYAEGLNILRGAAADELPRDQRYQFDLPDVAEVWRRGSVIGSWLLDLTAMALAEDPELSRFSGFVEDSGEGRWTIKAAIEEQVPANVLSAALYARFRSRAQQSFADKLLSAMRSKFGGHVEPRADG
jgi:6-phosphogluconate dehydrogenase